MLKPKLFNYSNEKFITKFNLSELQEKFEIIPQPENMLDLAPEELLKLKYDIIELAPQDYESFKPHLKAVGWRESRVGMADALIYSDGIYRPESLLTNTLLRLIKRNRERINSLLPVIVVGDIHFVVNVISQLSMNGFVKIIYSLSDYNEAYVHLIDKKIRSFIFDIDLTSVPINELTTSDITGALFISDFKKSVNKEAYELLTYFNFLSQGALFIDCNSIQDGFLVEDARKAEIAVVDELEFLTEKYLYLQENVKISP